MDAAQHGVPPAVTVLGDHVGELQLDGGRAGTRAGLQVKVDVRDEQIARCSRRRRAGCPRRRMPLGHVDGAGRQVRHQRVQRRAVLHNHEVAPGVARVALAGRVVGHVPHHVHHRPGGGGQHRQPVRVVVAQLRARALVPRAARAGGLEVERVPPLALVGVIAVDALGHRPAAGEGQAQAHRRARAEAGPRGVR